MLNKILKSNKLKQAGFVLLSISFLVTVFLGANWRTALADENKIEQKKLTTLITDFNNLKQNPFEPSKEDKIIFKNYNNQLKNKTINEKQQLQNEKKKFILNAKANRIKFNNDSLDKICSPKLAERFKELFDLNKNNIPLNGVGGGLVALDIKKCEINENNASIEANVTISLITQITTKEGKKFNHKVEGTGYERYEFIKIDNQWFIDNWKVINPDFSSAKFESREVDENSDDIVDEFVIDTTSDTIIDGEKKQSDEPINNVVNYGSKQ